jgi:sulfate adenylyltransferase
MIKHISTISLAKCASSLVLSENQSHEVELIASGYLHPLQGFMNRTDLESILKHSRLSSGERFMSGISLKVDRKKVDEILIGECLQLLDIYANPIGRLSIDDIYEHPQNSSNFMIGGRLNYTGVVSFEIRGLGSSPMHKIAKELDRRKKSKVIFFQSRLPPSTSTIERLVKYTVGESSILLIQRLGGPSRYKLISDKTLRRIYLKTEQLLLGAGIDVLVSELNLPGRDRIQEAFFLQIRVAAGLGATSLLLHCDQVPRDGLDLLQAVAEELGIQLEFWPEGDEYLETLHEIVFNGKTNILDKLENYQFVNILQKAYPPLHERGLVVMFVGLSGSGKTTHAQALQRKLCDRTTTLLDGDSMRASFSAELGYDNEARWVHIRRMKFIATEIVRHRGTVIISTVAPLREMREEFRQAIVLDVSSNFMLVHVNTSISDCKNRDVKGLYARAETSPIHMKGISNEYELPLSTDEHLAIEGSGGPDKLHANVKMVMDELMKKGFLMKEPDAQEKLGSEAWDT